MTASESDPWELLHLMGDRGWWVSVSGNGAGGILLEAYRDDIHLSESADSVLLAAPDIYKQAQRMSFAGE